jgi:polar amino acid transport system substrate-binding protein
MNKVWVQALLCVGLVLFLSPATRAAETIRLVADPWCPYNCEPDSERPGFMVEIAQRVFEEAGYEVEYHQRPWVRALQDTLQGEYHGVIGATRIEAPGFVFPDLALGQMANAFWTLSDADWQYQKAKSLEGRRLAVIAGYSYGDSIEAMLRDENHQHYITELHGASPLINGLKMLERRRIEVLLEDEHVMRYQLNKSGQSYMFKQAGYVPAEPDTTWVYIAFSPALAESENLARLLGEGVASLRASGELAGILSVYGVSDWR